MVNHFELGGGFSPHFHNFTSFLTFLPSILLHYTLHTLHIADDEWVPTNLDDGHLDYYFFLLAGLMAITLVRVLYVWCMVYVYVYSVLYMLFTVTTYHQYPYIVPLC